MRSTHEQSFHAARTRVVEPYTSESDNWPPLAERDGPLQISLDGGHFYGVVTSSEGVGFFADAAHGFIEARCDIFGASGVDDCTGEDHNDEEYRPYVDEMSW